MKLVHLSDLHIGKSSNDKRVRTIVDWIIGARGEHGASAVLITGDLVDDGALGEYREAQKQIKRLQDAGFPVLCTPGNHDYGANGIAEDDECYLRFRKYISGDVDYPHRVDLGDFVFILLDSMLQEMKEHNIWGAQGELGKHQLRELDRLLDDIESNAPEKTVVVALHHHPFYYNYFLALRDEELFKEVITDEDKKDCRVDAILFGHKHVEKRFAAKEKKYNCRMIYASGSSTERHDDGKMRIPVLDLVSFKIQTCKPV